MANQSAFHSADTQAEKRLKEGLTEHFNPKRALSRRQLKKKRGAFATSLIAAALMVLLAVAGTIAYYMTRVDSFENALLRHVDYTALGADEATVRSFARETIGYLSGAQEAWEPQITVGGFPASQFIPQSFREHMADVRDWVAAAKAIVLAGVGIVLALLGRIVFGGGRRSFSLGGYYLGAFLPLALLGGVGAWAYLDFESMWAWLHRAFIPEGIFNAAEPVMQLFPLALFADYLIPCAMTFCAMVGLILLLPALLAVVAMLWANRRKASGARGR